MLTTKLGPDGRVLVPVELRRELSFEPGVTLVAHRDGDRLVLESRDAILRRVRNEFAAAVPRDVSLADELITERRREAEREGR
jgi:bifunctional DNA-binding transcriptional regulator/antitoxin component of YhaV-PrlF toxin-antitoxin module